MSLIPISTKNVEFDEFDELIEFDRTHLISGSEIPFHDTPPLITNDELQKAKNRGDKICWILSTDGEKAGYFWTERKPQTMFLSGLAISPLFRGKKIGPQILRLMEEAAKADGLSYCNMAVSRFNKHAIHVYSVHGYQIVKEEPNYFGSLLPGRFRFIMQKEL